MREGWSERKLIRALRAAAGPVPVRFRIGDVAEEQDAELGLPVIRIADRRTALSLLVDPEIAFGDGYAEGRIEIDGDLLSTLCLLYKAPVLHRFPSKLATAAQKLIHGQSIRQARANARQHYSLDTDFYRAWLDREMVYTCAYFPEPGLSLDAAQKAKLDLICRKVWLQHGDRVVEAGCGWGALALHMAENYGVTVKAFNVCQEQIEVARESARCRGLESRVEFIQDDYRNLRGNAEVFVSVGMIEHVGPAHYQELADVIHRSIGDTGRGLLHFIGRSNHAGLSPWIQKRIFPGAYIPAMSQILDPMEQHAYATLDVENLRLHYARTLEFWLQNYEKHFDAVAERFGMNFARTWRLYLAGSAAGFHVGTLQLFQITFAGSRCADIPWSRAYLYQGEKQGGSQPWKTAKF